MLCGETLCGDKFLFSFPLHIATSMSMRFNNRVRKPVVCIDTCIYMQRRKRKYSLELDADWFVAMAMQLSIMRGQKKAAWPYRDPKIPSKYLEIFHRMPKYLVKMLKYLVKIRNILQNSKKFRKNSKKICKKPRNFVKIRKKYAKNKTHVFSMGKTKNIFQISEKFCKNSKKFRKIEKMFRENLKIIFKSPNEL